MDRADLAVNGSAGSGTGTALWLLAVACWVFPAGRGASRDRTRPAGVKRFPEPWRRGLLVLLGGAAAVVVVVPGLTLPGLFVAAAVGLVVARRPIRPSAAERTAVREEVIGYCTLLAGCLESGMPTATGMVAVGRALWEGAPSPAVSRVRDLLDAVAALSALGAPPEVAWESAVGHPDLIGLAAAAGRSEIAGTALARAVHDHAVRLRSTAQAEVEARSGRIAVLVAAPLGLCFLPAFLCVGLAPVVLGLLAGLRLH